MTNPETILVTGAAGFIGSNVVAALNNAGNDNLILCDWLRNDHRWMNLRKRTFRDVVRPDALSAYLRALPQPPKAIVHLGANSSTTETNGDELLETNFRSTLSLLDYCAREGVSFIYASSAATYGAGEFGFEDDFSLSALKRLTPLNLYGWSKHLIDKVVAERRETGLPLPPKCVGLKYFNVYGPNEYHKGPMVSVLFRNYAKAVAGEPIELFKSHREGVKDGDQRRDFVYVDDAAAVTTWFLDNGPACGLFNVGTGEPASFRELIEELFAAAGKPAKISYTPMPETLRSAYQYRSCASLSNLRRSGFAGRFMNVHEGVRRYLEILVRDDKYI